MNTALGDELLSMDGEELNASLAGQSNQARVFLRQLIDDGDLEPEHVVLALQTVAGQANDLARLIRQALYASSLNEDESSPKRKLFDIDGGADRPSPSWDSAMAISAAPVRLKQVIAGSGSV